MRTACPTDPVSVPHHYLDRLSQLAKSCIADLSALVDHLDQVRKENVYQDQTTTTTNLQVTTPIEDDGQYVFKRDGENWRLRFGVATGSFTNSVGMDYIHTLLRNRDRSMSAIEVARSREPWHRAGRSVGTEFNPDDPPTFMVSEDVMDEQTLCAIKEKLDDLDADIRRAAEDGDEAQQERSERQRCKLIERLNKDVRLGKRLRSLGVSPEEKARQAVKKSLSRAYDKLRRNGMEVMVAHLDRYLDTGEDCLYRPDHDFPQWTL